MDAHCTCLDPRFPILARLHVASHSGCKFSLRLSAHHCIQPIHLSFTSPFLFQSHYRAQIPSHSIPMSIELIFVYTAVSLAAPFVLVGSALVWGPIEAEINRIKGKRRETFTEYDYRCKEAKATGQAPPPHPSESATLRRKILLYRRRKNRVPDPLVGEPVCPFTKAYVVRCGWDIHEPVKFEYT